MEVIAEDANIRILKIDVGGTTWPNSYLVTCQQTGQSALIDVPTKADVVFDQTKNTIIKYGLFTHNHNDFLPALGKLRSVAGMSICGHPEDFDKYLISLDLRLKHGDIITLGKLEIKVIHTPGHTNGSLCILTEKYLFSGDTLLPGRPGYTASPSNFEQIMKSLVERVFTLPEETVVYPGHGNSTLIGKEKNSSKLFLAQVHAGLCGDVFWLKK